METYPRVRKDLNNKGQFLIFWLKHIPREVKPWTMVAQFSRGKVNQCYNPGVQFARLVLSDADWTLNLLGNISSLG